MSMAVIELARLQKCEETLLEQARLIEELQKKLDAFVNLRPTMTLRGRPPKQAAEPI